MRKLRARLGILSACALLASACGTAENDDAPTYATSVQADALKAAAVVWQVRTLAGLADAPRAYLDGPASDARFASPSNVAVAQDGTIYVTDRYNYRVRSIDKKGNVTTAVGMGPVQSLPYPMVGDPLNVFTDRPDAIAVLRRGELVFLGRGDGSVRKLNKRGRVENVAGGGDYNLLEGANDAVRFGYAAGIAADHQDNIYVPDSSRHVIRVIRRQGGVRVFAGTGVDDSFDGPVESAAIQKPTAVAVTSDGVVFFLEAWTRRVRKVEAGYVSTIAELSESALGIAINDERNLYVSTGTRILRIDQDGTVSTFAGGLEPGNQDGPAASARFSGAFGLAVAKDGSVLVGSIDTNSVRVIEPTKRTRNISSP